MVTIYFNLLMAISCKLAMFVYVFFSQYDYIIITTIIIIIIIIVIFVLNVIHADTLDWLRFKAKIMCVPFFESLCL